MASRSRFLVAFLFLVPGLFAQPSRIGSHIAGSPVVLRNRVHALARAANDAGPVDPGFTLPTVTLLLKPTAAQKAALQQLTAEQQDPASPNFHKWVTPEQFADRFGVSQADLDKIKAWLESQGFTVGEVGRGRTWINFTGTAAQAQTAFHTSIHRYRVNGETHFANATDPAVPAELADVVAGFRGLHNFRMQPRLRKADPRFNSFGTHALAPDDFATVYNVAPFYNAGIDGTGQSIVVVGQTAIRPSDVQNFRTKFNLGTANIQQVLVPRSFNPGVVSGDVDEAHLDIEWAGAVARNAKIIYVYSDDVFQSAIYAIDRNLAPVLSMSYGSCEMMDVNSALSLQQYAQQAVAQGMTWITAAGDSGAADCEDRGAAVAQSGLAVDVPAAIPEITAMGGTTLTETGAAYWNSSGSALSYMPESAWNDSILESRLSSGGGGASLFFARPSWQTGPGIPNDAARHVPDISLSSSDAHVPYYVYSAGQQLFGGTSAAAPSMAGIVALMNQYLVSTGVLKQPGLGNINPALYRLAQSAPGVFHDIVLGDNIVPCAAGTPDCVGGFVGKKAGPGYDEATGLGSIDAYELAKQWNNHPAVSSAIVASIDQNPVFQQAPDVQGNKWVFNVTLTEEAGIGTTLRDFTVDGVSYASQLATLFGKTAIAPGGSITAKIGLPTVAVPKTVTMTFSGVDATGTTWTTQLAVPFHAAQVPLKINGALNAASGQPVFAPGMIMSVYGTGMGNFAQTFAAVPLPSYLAGFEAMVNGVPAPLYYVSPTQVNIQIPYETQTGSATLTIGNPFDSVSFRFQVSSAAPGIFTAQDGTLGPFRTARRGETTTLYVTGDGLVSPTLATGSAPNARTTAQTPKPRQTVSVTVGGVPATVAFAGIPNGYVGVTQINYTVPANAPVGTVDVVVTIGAAASQTVMLTVTQ